MAEPAKNLQGDEEQKKKGLDVSSTPANDNAREIKPGEEVSLEGPKSQTIYTSRTEQEAVPVSGGEQAGVPSEGKGEQKGKEEGKQPGEGQPTSQVGGQPAQTDVQPTGQQPEGQGKEKGKEGKEEGEKEGKEKEKEGEKEKWHISERGGAIEHEECSHS